MLNSDDTHFALDTLHKLKKKKKTHQQHSMWSTRAVLQALLEVEIELIIYQYCGCDEMNALKKKVRFDFIFPGIDEIT